MKFKEEEITSISQLIERLNEHIGAYQGPIWFRGQSNSAWKLEPRLMRINPVPSESNFLNRFKQNASMILPNRPNSEFEWLFLMQHYGIPTRLLDWSESPLVALYFALNELKDESAALWVLMPVELNKLSRYRPVYEYEIPSFEDKHLELYLPSTIAAETRSSLLPMAAIAPRNSARMLSQQGVFTISHRDEASLESILDAKDINYIWRYIIPSSAIEPLNKELKLLGYSKFQLFPELESLSENFK